MGNLVDLEPPMKHTLDLFNKEGGPTLNVGSTIPGNGILD